MLMKVLYEVIVLDGERWRAVLQTAHRVDAFADAAYQRRKGYKSKVLTIRDPSEITASMASYYHGRTVSTC